MGFLFFVILIIIIVNVANSSKNNQSNISYQENSYSTPTYNTYNSYYRSSTPKLKFHSKADIVNLFGYSITNSLFYTCDSKSDMPFAINTKSTPSFGTIPSNGLNYWPNYNQISKTQQGYFIKWLADGKPFIEELGYAYIYYYGLEYRALVEKQDLKEVLFEVIDLANKFNRLRYGYDLIAYLTLSIKNFTSDEIKTLLEFFQNNEREYMYNPTYNSIIKNLTPEGKYKVKFSPCYYPYTEPSAAVDMGCIMCGGKGCRTCKGTGWMRVAGAGMVHPNVFEAVGYSRDTVGFAFGWGLNRLPMLYYKILEMRKLFENEVSLWEQL